MKKKHVLIADSDMRVCRVLSRIINRLNFKCFSAHEQHTFKSLCSEIEPDVIMLSLDMAEQDNLLEYLADRHPRATVVLSSNMDEDEIYSSKRVGQISRLNMGGFLRKPIDIDSVRTMLERLTEKSRSTLKKSLPFRVSNECVVHSC